jgi:hypothetical protein
MSTSTALAFPCPLIKFWASASELLAAGHLSIRQNKIQEWHGLRTDDHLDVIATSNLINGRTSNHT